MKKPFGKGRKPIVPVVQPIRGKAAAQLNPRNFGNLTAIKENAEAFSDNRCHVEPKSSGTAAVHSHTVSGLCHATVWTPEKRERRLACSNMGKAAAH